MPRYDHDLIAALAEGRLDPEQAAAIAEEIASDPVAAAELASQRASLDATSAAVRPHLTPSERTNLRAAVADALGVTAPDPGSARQPRRIPWPSLGLAAAALVALVAVVPVAGLLTTGGGDSGADLQLAAEAPTTAAVAQVEESSPADEAAAAVGVADANDALVPGADVGNDTAEFASSTTHAPSPTTTKAPTTTTTITAGESTTTSTVAAETTANGVERLTQELTTLKGDPAAVTGLSVQATEGDACWGLDAELRAVDPPPNLFRFEYEADQLPVVVYFEEADGVIGEFQVWGLSDCAHLVSIP